MLPTAPHGLAFCLSPFASRLRFRLPLPSPASLPIQPVRHLDKESIRRVQAEQIAHVTAEIVGSLLAREALASLVPHHEYCRARIVLPPQHDVGLKCLEVESAWVIRPRGIVERSVAILVVV